MQEEIDNSSVPNLIKANSVQLGAYGILILGKAGVGKSQLSLNLLERAEFFARPAFLIADDYSLITACDDGLYASCPENTAGLMEVRGAGILQKPFQKCAKLHLAVELAGVGERYPQGHSWSWDRNSCHIGQERQVLPLLKLPEITKADSLSLCHAVESWLFGKLVK